MARPARRLGNLPAEASSFIGRRRELVELRRKLASARLVSLVGPGGVGKTRLAVQIGSELARAFSDGTWLVELADVRDPALVSHALMAALDLRDQAATEPMTLLLSYLRDKDLLLVVDNCEHVLGAAAGLVSEVISASPGVRVLATSRQPLAAPGEQVVPVPPLELPSAEGAAPLAELLQNEAVMLLTERAAAASGSFELTTANQSAVVDVCRRLDGLPLAIELAAVRIRVLSVEQIRDRLTDRFALLTGGGQAALPRHQTLQTTFDWSHDLLDTPERVLFRRLCVFAGRFTLDDVESVCTSDDVPQHQSLNLVGSLVEKSLVIKEEARGTACYRLHETMREYASLKLREAGEEGALDERCAEYYHTRCQRARPAARYRLIEWLAWTDLEIDNIRSVLRRCIMRGNIDRALDLVVSLGWHWITRASTEGLRWLDELLALGSGNSETYAWAYFLRGFLALLKADPPAARPALARAVTVARVAGQLPILVQSLSLACIVEDMAGDGASGKPFLDEAEAVSAGLDDFPASISVLQAQALTGFFEGNLEAVRRAASEGADRSREVGDLYSLEMMLLNLGLAAFLSGDLDTAAPLFTEALRIAEQIDDRVAQYYVLDALGCHAAASGKARLAAQLIGAAETIRIAAGARLIPIMPPLLAQAEGSATSVLGAAKFDAEVKAGKSLTRDAAIRLALGEPTRPAAGDNENGFGPVLAKREEDVARLIAKGLSNKQIGARLFISERTVDSHVRSILNKLGFNSRAQIAGWVASSSH